jgi:hypothetical protein
MQSDFGDTTLDPERELRTLGAAERRRRRRGLAWTAAATCAALVFVLLAWEWLTGGAGLARPAGYAVATASAVTGLVVALTRWRAPATGAGEVAARLERLFPQARGRVTASLEPGDAGLAGARTVRAREWVARRGGARLDRAYAETALARLARWRRVTIALGAVALAIAVVEPAAGRRVVRAMLDPATLWSAGSADWRVTPGDAEVEYGAGVAGAARYRGTEAEGPLVLEWQEAEAAWRADTLGESPEGGWRWDAVAIERRYRLRFGSAVSPEYTLAVRAPLALVRVEARSPGEAWIPLAGRVVTADQALEVRGEANGALEAVVVVDAAGREFPLAAAGATFRGPLRGLSLGEARLVARGAGGRRLDGPAFTVLSPGSAFVEILRPTENPAALAAESAWLEVRAGAASGLAALSWETDDGRSGRLAAVAGARDTVVTAIAPLAAGRSPGDTIRYRVVARPAAGGGATSGWRTAVVASAAALRAAAAREREAAGEEVAAALAATRRAAEDRGDTPGPAETDEADRLDRRLAEAADSLARALDRTLSDPEIDPELAARLEAYRQQLEGVADAEFDPPRGAPPDPAAEAEARAAVLEAIAERLDEIERSIEAMAAADSLEALAGAQSALAEETRASEGLEGIAERQEALSDAAREAAAGLSEAARSGLEEALEAAAGEIEAGDAAAAADAQQRAAGEMMQAAGQTRAEVSEGGGASAPNRAALDRAGAESLFLAERQRELAEREGRLSDAGERAARLARQRVVTGGLDRALGTLVEAIGGQPAGMELAMRIAQAVYATRQAEAAVERAVAGPGGAAAVRSSAEDAATALALLARGLFLPAGGGGGTGGAGQPGESGALSDQLQRMAESQAAMADAMASGREPSGGTAEAAAAERRMAEELREMGGALEEEGLDARSIEALARAVEAASTRLERGLAGARTETDLRSLARRLADFGRMIDREESERRQSETARSFVPADPPPLEARVTAPVLDPATALAPWAGTLPAEMLAPARRYLERLADEGVRAREGEL